MNLTNILKHLREELDAVNERLGAAVEGIKASRIQNLNERRSDWIADASPSAQVKESSKKTFRAGSG